MRLRPASATCLLRGTVLFASAVLCLLAAGGVPAGASKRAVRKDAKRQIEDMETEWRDAQLTGNVGEMDKLLSEDYFGISMTGQVNTKRQQLDRIRRRSLVLSKIDLSDVKVKLLGGTAIVTSRAEVEGVSEGVPMRGSFRYTRVYQRATGGQWRITNFEATRMARGNRSNQPMVGAGVDAGPDLGRP